MSTVRRGRHLLERDGRAILPVGAHFVPVEGPDWPWRVGADAFDHAFGAMAAAGLDTVRIDLLWAAVEPEPGHYDEAHLAVLDEILAAARRHGLLLHPTLFVGGEVGDAYWDLPWRDGRQPHRDPGLLRHQVDQAAMLGRRWRDDPAILAWDLTDEPPLWLFRDTTDAEAASWTSAIADALRAADPDHLPAINKARQVMATYSDMEELIRLGAYRMGSSADVDEAIALHKPLEAFLAQLKEESTSMAEGYQRLERILRGEETQN